MSDVTAKYENVEQKMERLIDELGAMKHTSVRNYGTPGMTSWLIGGGDHGKVRMFTASRDTREWVTPHSHRYNFTCLVLRGEVTNILFEESNVGLSSNPYTRGALTGILGQYAFLPGTTAHHYTERSQVYGVGDTYGMSYNEIHSIRFSWDARVLFFEGPEMTNISYVLEPWAYGGRIPTFQTPSWMFESEPTETHAADAHKYTLTGRWR